MNTFQHFRILASASAILSAVLLPLSASATTVTTDPVGVVSKTVPTGITVLSVPFLNAVVFQGVIASEDGLQLSFSTSGIPDLSGEPYFVHVFTGDYAGETITIVSATSNSVTLEHLPAGSINGETVGIRAHHTLGSLLGSNNLQTDDGVSLYGSNNSVRSYFYFEGFGWFDAALEDANDVIVFPGEGMALSVTGSRELSFSGQVLTVPVAFPIYPNSINIMGTVNPAIGVSLEGLGLPSVLPQDASATAYADDGSLTADMVAFNYTDFGFYDDNFVDRNGYEIFSTGAVVIRSTRLDVAVIPPAYSSED